MSERKKNRNATGERDELLDLWRSFAVCAMVIYHLMWDLATFGRCSFPPLWSAYLIGGSFIIISGTAVHYSANPIRRGFAVFCAGILVSAVTAVVRQPVKFGILQLLGVCMMLYGALAGRVRGRRPAGLMCLCGGLFVLTWILTDKVHTGVRWLYPLGFRTEDFYSADYYPILPWIFLFCFGTLAGKNRQRNEKRIFPPCLTFLGRNSLVVYLLHQPLIYGVCWLLFR